MYYYVYGMQMPYWYSVTKTLVFVAVVYGQNFLYIIIIFLTATWMLSKSSSYLYSSMSLYMLLKVG